MSRRLPPSLLLVSPGRLVRVQAGAAAGDGLATFPSRVREALRAGARGLLLREPSLEDGAFLALGLQLRALMDLEAPGAWLGIHDRVHLAEAVRADGVHLAGDSLGAADARVVLGPEVALGVSTHDGDGPERWEGADYVMHAPVFPPNSKHAEGPVLGPDGLQRFSASCSLPLWALGGIQADRLPGLEGSGAAGAAAIGAVWGAAGDLGGAVEVGLERRVTALVEASESIAWAEAGARS